MAALLRLPEDRCILPLYKLAVGNAARGEMTIAGELEGEWQWWRDEEERAMGRGSKGISWWDWKKRSREDQGQREDWEWSVSGAGQEIKAEINIYILFFNNGSGHSLVFQLASSLKQTSIVVGTFSSPHLFNLQGSMLNNVCLEFGTKRASDKMDWTLWLGKRTRWLMQDFLDGGGSYWRSCPSPARS